MAGQGYRASAPIRAHLLRWRPRPGAQRTGSTPRARLSGAALQLDPSRRASWSPRLAPSPDYSLFMNAHTVVGRVAPRGAVARPAEWAPFVRPAARSAAIRRTGVGAGRAAAPRGDRTRPPRRHTVHE